MINAYMYMWITCSVWQSFSVQDQYVFLYHALYEFFRRSGQLVRKDDFLSEFANLNKAETKKQLSDEFNVSQ